MLRRLLLVALTLFLSLGLFADQKPDLKARADHSSGADQAKYAAEYAEQATRDADKDFAEGKDEEAFAQLKDVAIYGKMASDTSMQFRKREKNTEITLRKMLKQLNDIKNARPFEQQAEVQKVIDAVQATHDALLEFMFQKGH
jgi:hypothetical protein